MARGTCRHCSRLEMWIAGRGLCRTCYRKFWHKYGPLIATSVRESRDEPTEEELDELIAEQMKRLPRWWWSEVEAQREEIAHAVGDQH